MKDQKALVSCTFKSDKTIVRIDGIPIGGGKSPQNKSKISEKKTKGKSPEDLKANVMQSYYAARLESEGSLGLLPNLNESSL